MDKRTFIILIYSTLLSNSSGDKNAKKEIDPNDLEQSIERAFNEFQQTDHVNVYGLKTRESPCNNDWPQTFSLISKQVQNQVCQSSPRPSLVNFQNALYPCKYDIDHDDIRCLGGDHIDLKTIFRKASMFINTDNKHFKTFRLNNTSIRELSDNVFDDITFDEIAIYGCDNLITIDGNAFEGTNRVTKVITIKFNPLLKFKDNQLWKLLRKFPSLEKVSLAIDNVPVIPTNAFGQANYLAEIEFMGNYRKSSWKIVSTKAFSQLNWLNRIAFLSVHLDHIEDRAFAFENKSDIEITIDFENSMGFNINAFEANSLDAINKPARLLLGTPKEESHTKIVEYLDESVFRHFIENHELDLFNAPLDCSNSKNDWIRKNKLDHHIINFSCKT